MIARRFIRLAGSLVCLATALSYVRGKAWWLRLFDFPRVHFSALAAAVLGAGALHSTTLSRADRLLLKLVAASLAGQLVRILPYTSIAPKQVTHKAGKPGSTLRLITANIHMVNHKVRSLLELVERHRPDLVLVLETDRWWERHLASLEIEYRFCVKHPQDNTYGLCFFSNLELLNPEIRFLVQPDVPSLRTRVRLPGGEIVWLYGIHPKPPGLENRHGDLRGTGPRDAELIVVAREVRQLNAPAIVVGDFNDVAWSHTTQRFRRIGQMLDPRLWRGFYNTFHAGHSFFRFPVDQLYHSRHFAVVDFDRLSDIGSDHFPILAALSLERAGSK